MTTTFHDERLPVDIEIGARGGPSFQTTCIILNGGGEQRNQDWQEFRCKFDISYGIDSLDNLDEAYEFFIARRGRAHAFRFKDWKDYALDQELIGIGDGLTDTYQIIKTYEPSGQPYTRRITRPIAATTEVYVAGVLKTVTTDYTLDDDTGVITFTSDVANGAHVTVTCEFDVPCRFDTDEFVLTHEAFEAGNIQSLMLMEVRE